MKEYKCNVCGKVFTDRRYFYAHANNKKPCIDKKKLQELHDSQQSEALKTLIFETKVKTLEEEKKKLEELYDKEKKQKEDEIVRLTKLVEGIQEIKTVIQKNYDVDPVATPTTFNNCTIQNNINQNLNKNKNLNFSIQLAPNEKERYNHISNDQLLHILSNDDFTNALGDLTEAVYFNPKAPENMRWCVTDKNAQYGAIEYNHEADILQRTATNAVISKNLIHMIYGMSDIVEELRNTCHFDDRQAKNYSHFYDMIGLDTFELKHINIVKEKAYDSRSFVKALWEKLQLNLEKNAIKARSYTTRF